MAAAVTRDAGQIALGLSRCHSVGLGFGGEAVRIVRYVKVLLVLFVGIWGLIVLLDHSVKSEFGLPPSQPFL